MTTKNKFSLSRKEAADLLGVSTRTLDRYIRGGKLNSRKKGGTILLNEDEVNNLKVAKFQNIHGASPKVEGRAHRHIDSTQDAPEARTIIDAETGKIEEAAVEVQQETSTSTAMETAASVSSREQVFEELYDLARRENRETHNKLEAAQYRLGQLETQLKYTVPVLDYQEQKEALREQEAMVSGKLKRQEESLDLMEEELKGERLNKNIYIGLLFGLLALQPLLWLLLQG